MPNVIFIFYSIIGERNKNLFVIQSCVYLSKCQNETKSKIKQNRSRSNVDYNNMIMQWKTKWITEYQTSHASMIRS